MPKQRLPKPFDDCDSLSFDELIKKIDSDSKFCEVFYYLEKTKNPSQGDIFNLLKSFHRKRNHANIVNDFDEFVIADEVNRKFSKNFRELIRYLMSDDVNENVGKDFVISLETPRCIITAMNDVNTSKQNNADPTPSIEQIKNFLSCSSLYGLYNLSGLDFRLFIQNLDDNPANEALKIISFNYTFLRNVNFENTCLSKKGITQFHLCDLKNATFNKVEANTIFFKESDLEQADFRHADLRQAVFTQANLTQTNFAHANLENVKFTNTSLLNANLTHAIFKGMILEDIKISELNTVKFIPDVQITENMTSQDIFAHFLTSLTFLQEQIKESIHAPILRAAITHDLIRCIHQLIKDNQLAVSDAKDILFEVANKSPQVPRTKLKFFIPLDAAPLFSLSQEILDQAITELNAQIPKLN